MDMDTGMDMGPIRTLEPAIPRFKLKSHRFKKTPATDVSMIMNTTKFFVQDLNDWRQLSGGVYMHVCTVSVIIVILL
jgi:hypothetical protein